MASLVNRYAYKITQSITNCVRNLLTLLLCQIWTSSWREIRADHSASLTDEFVILTALLAIFQLTLKMEAHSIKHISTPAMWHDVQDTRKRHQREATAPLPSTPQPARQAQVDASAL